MRLPLRKLVFWLHLVAALAAGAVILLMAATGLLLSFEAQIVAWSDAGERRIAPVEAGAAPLPIESLLAAVARDHGSLAVTGVTVKRDPTEAVALALGRTGVVHVDPYRGTVIEPGSGRLRALLRSVIELHRYLAAAGDARPLGKAVTGASNLVFLFVLLSGLYLWVPRLFHRLALRNVLWFRRGLSAKARDLNWHHVLGIWAAGPLLLIVVCALPISYTWAGDLVMRATGSAPPSERSGDAAVASGAGPGAAGAGGTAPSRSRSPASAAGRAPSATVTLAAIDVRGLDRVIESAAATAEDWRSLSVRLPVPASGAASVVVDRSVRRGRPDLRATLVIDRASGEVVGRELFADQSLGRRTRSWMRWIHTGEAGGVAGQTVGALACAAALVLGWTGFALAWRRFMAWRSRVAITSAPGTASSPLPADNRERSRRRARG